MGNTDDLGRRAAILAGTAAWLALPRAGRAQTAPSVVAPPVVAPPVVAPPVVAPPVVAPPVVTPPVITPPQVTLPIVPAPRPARPAVPVTAAIDKTKIYYVFFEQMIDVNSMKTLRRQLAALVDAEVSQIVLVINSAGGNILQSLTTYSFIRALPVRIDTHTQSIVASAANALFLSGEERSADHGARFMFHPSQATVAGLLTDQQIQEQLGQLEAVGDMTNQIYHERTTLSDAEIDRFNHGQVIYTADQAKQNGIIQTVADLKVPSGQTAKMLFLE